MESDLNKLNDQQLWQAVKPRIFKACSTWDILIAKVKTSQPHEPMKWMHRMFEELEFLLNMFQMLVGNNCSFDQEDVTLSEHNHFINPDVCVSKFLGVTPHTTKIYLRNNWDLCALTSDTYAPDPPEEVTVKVELKDEDDQFETCQETKYLPPPIIKQSVLDVSSNKKCNLYGGKYQKYFPVSEEDYNKMKAGEIPKQCPKCNTFFSQMNSVRRHFTSHKSCETKIKAPEGIEFQTEDPSMTDGAMRYGCAFKGCYEKSQRLWKYRYSVHVHYQEKHCDPSDLHVECKLCNKKFLSTRLLKAGCLFLCSSI